MQNKEIIFRDAKREYTYDLAVKVAMEQAMYASRKWKSSFTDEEFEDLASMAYLCIPKAIRTFTPTADGKGSFEAWVRFSAHNQMSMEWQVRNRKKRIPIGMTVTFTDLSASTSVGNSDEDDNLQIDDVIADPTWNRYQRIEDRDELLTVVNDIDDENILSYHLARISGYTAYEANKMGFGVSSLTLKTDRYKKLVERLKKKVDTVNEI